MYSKDVFTRSWVSACLKVFVKYVTTKFRTYPMEINSQYVISTRYTKYIFRKYAFEIYTL